MKFIHIFILLSITNIAIAQEICDNGIDDDGDGAIDILDSDCLCTPPSVGVIMEDFESFSDCPEGFGGYLDLSNSIVTQKGHYYRILAPHCIVKRHKTVETNKDLSEQLINECYNADDGFADVEDTGINFDQVESDFKDGYNVYPDLDKENREKMILKAKERYEQNKDRILLQSKQRYYKSKSK